MVEKRTDKMNNPPYGVIMTAVKFCISKVVSDRVSD